MFVSNLRSGLSKSCGCPAPVLLGMFQGKLHVLGYPWVDSKGEEKGEMPMWQGLLSKD